MDGSREPVSRGARLWDTRRPGVHSDLVFGIGDADEFGASDNASATCAECAIGVNGSSILRHDYRGDRAGQREGSSSS